MRRLRRRRRGIEGLPHRYDLAEEWSAWQGLPFVFARWMVRTSVDREGKAALQEALAAAETGHLVLSTLHTNSAAQTIHRIVDSFPPEQQQQIRAQLSGSLLGVISQRLLPRLKGGLIPACEIMMTTPAVPNLIRENKIAQIKTVIQTSAEEGMVTMVEDGFVKAAQGITSIEEVLRVITE